MNANMREPFAELRDLLAILHEDELTVEQESRIEQLVAEDISARRFYLEMMFLYGHLQWKHRRGEVDNADGTVEREEGRETNTLQIPGQQLSHPQSPIGNPLPTIVVDASSPPTISAAPLSSFVGSWMFANLFALLIMGLGVFGAWLYQIDIPQPTGQNYRPTAWTATPPVTDKRNYVGQITGMADVRWADGAMGALGGARVPLGRKYVLASGLMEITYDTGAKVTLQGPCTYDVDSRDGGFLSIGKLTARLDNAKPQAANQKSSLSTIHDPLFTIKTPTATVTDLGTEFGVEVNRDGDFEVHVLQGRVKTTFCNETGKTISSVTLSAGEARRRDGRTAQVTAMASRPASFSKIHFPSLNERYQRWLAYSKQLRNDPSLTAYYSFESMGKATSVLPNVTAAGEQLNGEVVDAEWVNGRFPEKAALFFHGNGTNDHVALPQHERFNFTGPFSVAVWFKARYFTRDYQTLAAKGDSAWRLHRNWAWNTLSLHVNNGPESEYHCTWTNSTPNSKNAADDRWHLATAVVEPAGNVGRMKLFLDGRLDAEGESPLPLSRNNEPVWLGNNSRCSDRAFPGLIDEVAIFNRAISAAEIKAMFKAGNPAATAGE